MVDARHKAQTIIEGLHSAIAFEYANEAQRLAAGPFESFDRNKFALQTDTNEIFILLDENVPTWGAIQSNITPPVDPDEDGYVTIANNGNLIYLKGTNDGDVLTWNESSNSWESQIAASGLTTVSTQFSLTETVNNTTAYFFTWSSNTSGGIRSSSNTGMQNANSCNPYIVPFDATIKEAVLVVKGVGVQNGTVTYPVSYETDLLSVNFSNETKLADIDFSIPVLFSVGTFSVGNTNFRGSTSLNINVNKGDSIGMRFQNGNGASTVGQTKMAFITLILEKR